MRWDYMDYGGAMPEVLQLRDEQWLLRESRSQGSPQPAKPGSLCLFLDNMKGLVENIRWDPVLCRHRAGRSGVVSPRIHFEFYDYCQGGPALPLLWYIVGHCCRRALDGGNYYSYYFFYYYYYYNYYYNYCYYYYCRDPMSSTRNPTVLFGV